MLNKEKFIERSLLVHGDKYNYDKVVYTKSINKVIITCPIHGDFKQEPHSHMKGQGCPYCGILKRSKTKTMTTEEFVSKAKELTGEMYDFSKTEYVKTNQKVVITCKKHGDFLIKPNSLISAGEGCPKCGMEKLSEINKITKEEFFNRVDKKHGDKYDYSKMNYTNISTPITIICPNHGEFVQTPYNHLKTYGCPKCSQEMSDFLKVKTTEQFINDAKKVHGDKYDYTNVVYTGSHNFVDIICKKHGNFKQIASYHLSGNGCQLCALEQTTSSGENEIYEYIKSILPNVEIKKNDRTLLKNSELDIFIPSLNIAFEYDGLYWHSELKKEDKYHLNKTNLCESLGIQLIHIFEDEWLFKKDIVKSRIKNLLKKNDEKIYARKCDIREVSYNDSKLFLEKNHIQGNVMSKIRYGLYYNNELVSLMTFGKLRKSLGSCSKENCFELLRFCNKLNYSVVGGASKLFKHFIKCYNPEKIISYADRRWSIGKLYDTLGFKMTHFSKPNYFYIKNGLRKNRFEYRKDILVSKYGCPIDMTEKEFCKINKIYRIYDSGTIVFKYTKKE